MPAASAAVQQCNEQGVCPRDELTATARVQKAEVQCYLHSTRRNCVAQRGRDKTLGADKPMPL